jgi:hypothetical protein
MRLQYRQKVHPQFLSSHFSHQHTFQFLTKFKVKASVVNYPNYSYTSNLLNLYFSFFKVPRLSHSTFSTADLSTEFSVTSNSKLQSFSFFSKNYCSSVQTHFIEGLTTFEAKRSRKNENFKTYSFKLPSIETSDFTRHVQPLFDLDMLPYELSLSFTFSNKNVRVRTCEDLVRMHAFPVRIF